MSRSDGCLTQSPHHSPACSAGSPRLRPSVPLPSPCLGASTVHTTCGRGQWSHPIPTEAGLQRLTQSSRRGPYLGVPDPVGSRPLQWIRDGPASQPRITERACETPGEFSSGRMAGAGRELPGRVCRGSPPPPTNHTTHTAATLFLLTTPQADGHCSGGLGVRLGWHRAPTDEGTEGPCVGQPPPVKQGLVNWHL